MTISQPTEKEDIGIQIELTSIVNNNNSEVIHIVVGHHPRHEDGIFLREDGNMSTIFKKHANIITTQNVDHGINST